MSDKNQERLMGGAVALGDGAELGAGSVVEFMVMPGGTHTAWFKKGTKSVQRTVEVTRGAADNLQRQLAATNAAGKVRAFFDFDHEGGAASGWPMGFAWREKPEPGVYVRAELSEAGANAIRGKNYRSFSPVFYVDDAEPARVICKERAALDFGSLVNDPAFKEIAPLWATNGEEFPASDEAGKAGAKTSEQQQTQEPTEDDMNKEALAGLQATVKTLEHEVTALKGKNSSEEKDRSELRAKESALDAAKRGIEVEELRAKNGELEASIEAGKKKFAEEAVKAAVNKGQIPPKDEALKARYVKLITEDAENITLLAVLPENESLKAGRVTDPAAGRLEAKEGPKRLLGQLGALILKAKAIQGWEATSVLARRECARDIAAIYAKEFSPGFDPLQPSCIPLRAKNADTLACGLAEMDTEPLKGASAADTLGTLSGTLVAQRTMELFKYEFPMVNALYTDFSDQPAQFNTAVNTRIIGVPAVQTYNSDLDANGYPKGWETASAASTTNVNVTLDEHVGVPIPIDSNTLASTVRRLFDEVAPAANFALGKYFMDKVYALFTAANFNAYAAVVAGTVPDAYATFPIALLDMSRGKLSDLGAVLDQNKVPTHDRGVLLLPKYHAKLENDPSLVTFFAGQQAPEIVTSRVLPELAGFRPYRAPNFPTSANRVGFAFQKCAAVLATRLSNDYSQALPGASYGSVMTITNPDSGISVVLVQYVDHAKGIAVWRIQVMLGAAKGDNRAGLLITSN